jgi:hypothetical protein
MTRSSTSLGARIAVAAMMLLALVVRARELDQGIVRFHPTRHYRSAVLARACYYDHAAGIPEWARRVANANREMQQAGEPPIMEWLACGAYLMAGREIVMIPRALAALIWVMGAVPLWLLAVRLTSVSGALLATSLYLFLPYSIVASRNFQPDQLMTVAAITAILMLVRHHDRPTRARFAAAAAAVALAGFIKPMSVFVTAPVVTVLAFSRGASLRPRIADAAVSLAAGLLPPIAFYGYSALAGSLIQDQMRMRFEPHLIATAFFWNGLWQMASRVETGPLLAVAIGAIGIASDRITRRVIAALFAGYAMFAVVFTYHMPTHDYYHLPYIAVTALGAGAVFARFAGRAPAVVTPVLCAIVALVGAVVAWPRLHTVDAPAFERTYQAIGALVGHDTRALFLDTEYGFAMMYHAEMSGDSWPNQDDLAAEAIDGRPAVDAETRFVRDYAAWRPNFFVVTDLGSLAAAPDLQSMLARRTTPVAITGRYRVYRFNR